MGQHLRAASLLALLQLAACGNMDNVVRVRSQTEGLIQFDDRARLPKDLPEAMPVYRLSPAPLDPEVAKRFARAATLKKTYSVDSGSTEFLPSFDRLAGKEPDEGGPLDRKGLLKQAREQLTALIPKDEASEWKVDRTLVLNFARLTADQPEPRDADPRQAKMIYAVARRTIAGLPVDGPGSRLVVALARDPDNRGLLRDIKRASNPQVVKAAGSEEALFAEIRRQLRALQPHTTVRVRRIELAYYDGGRDLLQPVYRYVAEIEQNARSVGSTQHVVGYVPYAITAEPIPSVDSDLKATAQISPDPPPASAALTVGVFITRRDKMGWLTDANAFSDALQKGSGALEFVTKHQRRAEPSFFLKQEADFVDSVDVALVEAHGFPWGFVTRGDCCDVVPIAGLDSVRSYGDLDGAGRLKHWILHSCDAVPAPPDSPLWASPWFKVFKGLNSAIGYRTSMFINDGAGAAIGASLRAGAAVVPAWFSAIASLNVYAIDDSAEFECEEEKPMGRAAAIVACGTSDATAAGMKVEKPDCLEAWWMSDELVEHRARAVAGAPTEGGSEP